MMIGQNIPDIFLAKFVKKDTATPEKSSTTPEIGVPAIDIVKKRMACYMLPGFEFLGAIPPKFTMLVYGKPGHGKSSFALMLADALANTGRPTVYVSAEEGVFSPSLRKKLVDFEIFSKNLFINDTIPSNIEGITNIFLDSISFLRLNENDIVNLRNKLTGALIAVAHCTKEDRIKYKGESDISHFADILIEADNGIMTTIKNRFAIANLQKKIWSDVNENPVAH